MGNAKLNKTRDSQIIAVNICFVGDKIGDKIL